MTDFPQGSKAAINQYLGTDSYRIFLLLCETDSSRDRMLLLVEPIPYSATDIMSLFSKSMSASCWISMLVISE